MTEKHAYALGYYYGRTLGTYEYFDLDALNSDEQIEYKLGYENGMDDHELNDMGD
jgi:hypothetical protein